MATALARNATLRCIYHSLTSKNTLHQQLRSTNLPPFRLFHGSPSPQSLLNRPLPQWVIKLDGGLQSLAMYHRYLCSNSTAATVSQANSTANGSSQGHSREGDKSDQSQDTAKQEKSVRGGPVSWLSFLLLVATGAGLIFYYDNEKRRHIEDINNASIAVKQGPSVGKAAIGGPFNLINHDGKGVTERDFMGKWTVMYFGFTHCPDICPDELQKLAAAVDKIKFHPNLIGLTGNPEEIKKVARAYRVYYMKTEEEGSDYLVDHSIVMYLMDPNMEFVKFYGKNNDVDALSDGIIKEIKQYKKVKA